MASDRALPARLPRRAGRQHALHRHVRRLRVRDSAATRAARRRRCGATWSTTLGRVTSYCFLGAVVGHVRLAARRAERRGQPGVASRSGCWPWLSGALMVFIGLQFLGVLPRAAAQLGRRRGAGAGAARLAQGAGPRRAARLRRAQRPAALPAGLCVRGAGGGERRPAARARRSWRPSASAPSRRMLAMGGIGCVVAAALPAAAHGAACATPSFAAAGRASGLSRLARARRAAGRRASSCCSALITIARGVLPMQRHCMAENADR